MNSDKAKARNAKRQTLNRQRAQFLEHARKLARSGRFADQVAIIAHMESAEGFAEARERLVTIRYQLDQLCRLAGTPAGLKPKSLNSQKF